MKASWQEQATHGVYVEACPISRSLLEAAARSRAIPGDDAEVGGMLDCPQTPHSTPSVLAVIISWTRSSAPIFSPSHQRPLRQGSIWYALDGVGTVLGMGVDASLIDPSPFDPGELRVTALPLVPLPLRPRTRQRGRGPKCQRVGNTCECAQRSRESKLGSARLGLYLPSVQRARVYSVCASASRGKTPLSPLSARRVGTLDHAGPAGIQCGPRFCVQTRPRDQL